MKIMLIVIAVVALIIAAAFVAGCNSGKPAKAQTGSGIVYTCPMHPEVISDKPGKCPKCGMNLVVKETGTGSGVQGAGTEKK